MNADEFEWQVRGELRIIDYPSRSRLVLTRDANGRVASVEDVLTLGDVVKVEVLEVDPKTGKISLDRLDKPDAPEGAGNGGERRERSDRPRREA